MWPVAAARAVALDYQGIEGLYLAIMEWKKTDTGDEGSGTGRPVSVPIGAFIPWRHKSKLFFRVNSQPALPHTESNWLVTVCERLERVVHISFLPGFLRLGSMEGDGSCARSDGLSTSMANCV